MAEDDSTYLTGLGQRMDEDVIQDIIRKQADDVKNRIQRFRNGKPLRPILGRTIIIVDDGIATDSTMIPAILLCKAQNAAKIILASPVSADRDPVEIVAMADQIVVLERPKPFYAVGQAYKNIENLSDSQVMALSEDFDLRISRCVR